MKKLCQLLIFLLLLGVAWGQTPEQTIAEIGQLKTELETARLTVERKTAELNLPYLNIAPKDAFESEADYLIRLQGTPIEINADIIALRQQYLDPLLDQLYALQSRSFSTTGLTITPGAYNAENETWPVTIKHGSYQKESIQINIPIKKDQARIWNSSWDKTILTGQLAIDYDNQVRLTSITITHQDSGLNYSHTPDRRWKELVSNDGALQLGVSYSNRYIIRAIDGMWTYWVGLNDLNDPNLKLSLGLNPGQDDTGAGTLAVSPNELNAAYIAEGGKVCEMIIGTNSKQVSDKYDPSCFTLEYSPDGRYVFAGLRSGKVYVYESGTMKLVKIYNTSLDNFRQLKCPAGDVFYLLGYEYRGGLIKVVDYKLGSLVKSISLENALKYNESDSITEARLTQDASCLVLRTGSFLGVLNLATVTWVANYRFPVDGWSELAAALSNDGKYWGLLKYISNGWSSQYALSIVNAEDSKRVYIANYGLNSSYIDDPLLSWTNDNKYLIVEGAGLYRTGLDYSPQTPARVIFESYNFPADSLAQAAILAFETSNEPASLEYFEREITKPKADPTSEPRPQYYYWTALRYTALGDPQTAQTWIDAYLKSGDQTYLQAAEQLRSVLVDQKKVFGQSSVEAMPERLATPFGENNFVVSPDGQWLYFSAMTAANTNQTDIFRAPRINSEWGVPARVNELSTPEEEALCSFSQDGKQAWLAGKYAPAKADWDIYTSDQDNSRWLAPAPVAALNSPAQDLDPWIHADRLLLFSSNREGGLGGYDLYYSRFRNGAWTAPANLGAVVNTPYDETAPFLDWNGHNLFYSSTAPTGLGGADIYRVAVLNEDIMGVSLPQNCGVPLNSRNNDLRYLKLRNSGESLVISDRGLGRKPNMYLAYTEYPEQEGYYVKKTDGSFQWNLLSQNKQNAASNSAGPELLLKGKVSGLSPLPANAKVDVSYLWGGEQRRTGAAIQPNGDYQATLPAAASYTVEFSLPGYYRHYQVLTPGAGETTLRHDIALSKLETQASVILNNIFFAYDSAEILPASQPSLDNAVNTLLDNPGIRVEISGHTSNEGSDDYNLDLSLQRAKSVVQYLIQRGIPADRLTWKGYGETKPLNDNSNEALKQQNRRVEFKVL